MEEKKEVEAQPEISPSSSSSSISHHDTDIEAVESRTDDLEALEQVTTSKSEILPEPQFVPRNCRRGLLARFSVVPETTTPIYYARKTKWIITFIVAIAGAAAPMGSASILPTLTLISEDFHTTNTITNLSVALYMLALSIFPLWWSSFSEQFGRRSIYIVSFVFFVVFTVLSALAENITWLIVVRLLSGGSAGSVQAVGAGTISDIWEPKERGKAMGLFYLGPLMGPLLMPIIGGALANSLGWRSTQWFLVIYGGVVLVLIIFALPETLARKKPFLDFGAEEKRGEVVGEAAVVGVTDAPEESKSSLNLQRTTTRQSIKAHSKKSAIFLKRCLIDPLRIILLLRYPAVAITVYYAAIAFGSLYTLNVSIELTFSRAPYNFSTLIVGLLYIPNSIGYVLASIFGGRWLDHVMKREARKKGRIDAKGKLILRPEDRMQENAWLAAFMFPLALIWYGWAAEKGVHWIVPVSFFWTLINNILTKYVDDCKLLLWHRFNDHFCHVNDHAHGVYAQASIDRHSCQQLC
jgi:multidrug resistance protein